MFWSPRWKSMGFNVFLIFQPSQHNNKMYMKLLKHMFDQEAEVRLVKITILREDLDIWSHLITSLQKRIFMENALNRMVVGPPASSAPNQHNLLFSFLSLSLNLLKSVHGLMKVKYWQKYMESEDPFPLYVFSTITVFNISKKTLLFKVINDITNVSPIWDDQSFFPSFQPLSCKKKTNYYCLCVNRIKPWIMNGSDLVSRLCVSLVC